MKLTEFSIFSFLTGPIFRRRLRSVRQSFLDAGASEDVADAACLLEALRSQMPKMLREHARHDAGFRKRSHQRWKAGLDLFKMFLVISQEIGSDYNKRARPAAFENRDHRFEAIVAIHARSLRVAGEIYALLQEGYPDGALGRWRTLHELAVTATFLANNDDETARRFIAHRGIAAFKALRQYQHYLPRSNMTPLGPGELERARHWWDRLVEEFGKPFGEDMGWAFPVIDKKKGINLLDLEEATGLDHWRPRFKWASDDIHASAKPYHAGLGVAEVREPVLLTGRSNSAFTDPVHMAVISLNLVNHALPDAYRTEMENRLLLSLRILEIEIGETFLALDHAAPARSAEARQDGVAEVAPRA